MCCQARVRAGVATEASDINTVEFPLDTLESRRDATEHSSMQYCRFLILMG